MKFYVINMERSVERRELIENQFKKHNITKYEFVKATDGFALDDETIEKMYCKQSTIDIVRRPLSKGEIGCADSHYRAYKAMLESGERGIIIEDDVVITDEFLDFYAHIKTFPGKNNIIFLGFQSYANGIIKMNSIELTIPHKPTKLYAKIHPRKEIVIDKFTFYKLNHRASDICGTYAYSPSLDVAQRFVNNIDKNKIRVPSDAFFNLEEHLQIDMYGMKYPLIYADLTQGSYLIRDREAMGEIARASKREEQETTGKLIL